ncbi:MAG: hypothetical protein Q9170_001367 [Blastenia crenularia]
MSIILADAQVRIKSEIVARGGNKRLKPPDIPWYFTQNGLTIRAQTSWWTWQLLSDAITGLQSCALQRGVFQEIDVVGLLGPGTPRVEGQAFLSLVSQSSANDINGYTATCIASKTTTRLQLLGSGHEIDSFAMGRILFKALKAIDSMLSRGDRHLTPSEIPWTFSSDGLLLKAELSGWSFRLLRNTIAGVQECSYQHGMYEEVFATSVVDPRGMDPNGNRFLSLIQAPDPGNIGAPRPLPQGLQNCRDPDTNIRLLYELEKPVSAYAMQEVIDGAQNRVESKIATEGADHKLGLEEYPWAYGSNGLVITAKFDGWTWGFLNRTVGALRACPFRRGQFGEVLAVDIVGADAPSGQRYLDLKIQ